MNLPLCVVRGAVGQLNGHLLSFIKFAVETVRGVRFPVLVSILLNRQCIP